MISYSAMRLEEVWLRIHAFVQKEREVYKDNLLLLDNGDILQGQPCAYYYNYIDTISPHLAAEVLTICRYNTGNMGIMMWRPDVPCSTVGQTTASFPF